MPRLDGQQNAAWAGEAKQSEANEEASGLIPGERMMECVMIQRSIYSSPP
jgi:hypothetical protein